MGKKIDLTGRVFGRLKVLSEAGHNRFRELRWMCICVCGEKKITSGSQLRKGLCKSCGCLSKDRARETGRARKGELSPMWKGGHKNHGSLAHCIARLGRLKDHANRLGHKPPDITPEELALKIKEHSGNCDLCGKSSGRLTKGLCLDHCHVTGKFRGFLCSRCNACVATVAEKDPGFPERISQYFGN